MQWNEKFTRAEKPSLQDITQWLGNDRFETFCKALHAQFGLVPSRAWSSTHGWTYSFGYSGLALLKGIRFKPGAFVVEGIAVMDDASYQVAITATEKCYAGFAERLDAHRKARAARNAQKRTQATPKETASKDLSACAWPKKVTRAQLLRLYKADAEGIPDVELADEIGSLLHHRCLKAKQIWDLMESGRIQCTGCSAVLDVRDHFDVRNLPYSTWGDRAMTCPCGARYAYRAYRQSYRANNMPRGAASPVFDQFIADWERIQRGEYALKMRLIDNLVHAFHISILGGTAGRPVGINLIQGTKAQVEALILQLARQTDEVP